MVMASTSRRWRWRWWRRRWWRRRRRWRRRWWRRWWWRRRLRRCRRRAIVVVDVRVAFINGVPVTSPNGVSGDGFGSQNLRQNLREQLLVGRQPDKPEREHRYCNNQQRRFLRRRISVTHNTVLLRVYITERPCGGARRTPAGFNKKPEKRVSWENATPQPNNNTGREPPGAGRVS